MVIRSLNSGAQNVSWQRLSSQDIVYYKVHFSGGSVRFPSRSSWGVVEGGEQFEVAAVVIVNGREVEGERSTPATSVGVSNSFCNICVRFEEASLSLSQEKGVL